MSLTEALGQGLKVTGVGLIVVFSVLVILMLVMMAMKVIFYKPENKDKSQEAPKAPSTAPEPVIEPAAAEESVDDGALIAVITAAVAAAMDTPASRLKIKSFKRVSGAVSAWNRAGVKDIIDSRF